MVNRPWSAIMLVVPFMILLSLLSSCAHSWGLRYPPARWMIESAGKPMPAPSKAIPFLAPQDPPPDYTRQVEMLFELTARVAELPAEAIPGGTAEAQNVNDFDEAPDSGWFTNRLGRREMTATELVAGPGLAALPADKQLSVIALGLGDVAAWATVKGSAGDEHLLIFDDPQRPEMATAAAFFSSRVFHAAGYNVPASSLSAVDPRRFALAPGATFRDAEGNVRPATPADLQGMKEHAPRQAGTPLVRTFVTKKPEGIHIGPFSFSGRRHSDPGDRIPHQHRRELRGLDAFAAWVDHRLAIDSHTADIFVPSGNSNGSGHLRHYLLGFEDSLGNLTAALAGQKEPEHPQAQLKPTAMGLPSVTLYSRNQPPLQKSTPAPFDAKHLDPYRWETHVPNHALWGATNRDELWAGAILMRFTDDRIAALADAARFPSKTERDRIVAALIGRRDKLLAFWLPRLNPIGNFSIAPAGGGVAVAFSDYARDVPLPGTEGSTYRWRLRTANGRDVIVDWQTADAPQLQLSIETVESLKVGRIVALQIQTKRPDREWPSPSVDLFLRKEDSGTITLLGIRRHAHN